jgi:hypothetical protein
MYKYNYTFGLLPKAGKGLVHCANLTKKKNWKRIKI